MGTDLRPGLAILQEAGFATVTERAIHDVALASLQLFAAGIPRDHPLRLAATASGLRIPSPSQVTAHLD